MHPEDIHSLTPGRIRHPVLAELIGRRKAAASDPQRARLITVDARETSLADALCSSGVLERAIQTQTPVLVLSPSAHDMEILRPYMTLAPRGPRQASLIVSRPNHLGRYDVVARSLCYESIGGDENVRAPKSPPVPRCGGARKAVLVSDDLAVRHYIRLVQELVDKPLRLDSTPVPAGVIYMNPPQSSDTYPFTYTDHGPNYYQGSAGSMTIAVMLWGFLSQTAQSNEQYIVLQNAYTLNPGNLAQNDKDGCGYINAEFFSAAGVADFLAMANGHQPTSSSGGTVDVCISYLQEEGGYTTWEFDNPVVPSLTGWSVADSSVQNQFGSEWYVSSPWSALDWETTWKNAFTGVNHMEPEPAQSTGELSVNEVSAFNASPILNGSFTVDVWGTAQGAYLWGSECDGIDCLKPNLGWPLVVQNISAFDVDLTPLQPAQS